MIEIRIDENALRAASSAMKTMPRETCIGVAVAINRTVTHTKATLSKTVRARYIVKAAAVKSSLHTEKANKNKLFGKVESRGKTLPMGTFRTKVYKKGPMKAQVLKGGGMKPIKGLFVGKTFKKPWPVQRMGRRTNIRLPAGPSVPQMIGNENVLKKAAPEISEFLNRRILHEISYRLNKGGSK